MSAIIIILNITVFLLSAAHVVYCYFRASQIKHGTDVPNTRFLTDIQALRNLFAVVSAVMTISGYVYYILSDALTRSDLIDCMVINTMIFAEIIILNCFMIFTGITSAFQLKNDDKTEPNDFNGQIQNILTKIYCSINLMSSAVSAQDNKDIGTCKDLLNDLNKKLSQLNETVAGDNRLFDGNTAEYIKSYRQRIINLQSLTNQINTAIEINNRYRKHCDDYCVSMQRLDEIILMMKDKIDIVKNYSKEDAPIHLNNIERALHGITGKYSESINGYISQTTYQFNRGYSNWQQTYIAYMAETQNTLTEYIKDNKIKLETIINDNNINRSEIKKTTNLIQADFIDYNINSNYIFEFIEKLHQINNNKIKALIHSENDEETEKLCENYEKDKILIINSLMQSIKNNSVK